MRISVTERQLYKRCRRKWDYAGYSRQALTPIINAPALDLGTVIHATLAQWRDDPDADPLQIYSTLALASQQAVIDSYTQRIGCAPAQAELEPTQDALALGMAMIKNYQTKWHKPVPPGFDLVQNELTLVVPIPATEHCTCESYSKLEPCACAIEDGIAGTYHCKDFNEKPCACEQPCPQCTALHELEATFDAILADANNDLFILECKTFSRTPSIEELQNNDQFLAYQWALAQTGKSVVGVAYDGLLKKPAPSGVHKDLDSLFLRRLLLRNQHELDEFGSLLPLEVIEMANPNVPIYKTVPPVQGCQRWECSFIDVCHAQSKGEPTTDLLRMFVRSDRKKHLDLTTEVEA